MIPVVVTVPASMNNAGRPLPARLRRCPECGALLELLLHADSRRLFCGWGTK